MIDDALIPADVIENDSLDLGTLDLAALEQMSYEFAGKAGEYETNMWVVLAHIKQTGKWKQGGQESWEQYSREWLHEVCNRVGRQQPFSLREIQTRLANAARFGGVGADTALVLGASSDAMAKLSRAIGEWTVDGALVEMKPVARKGLETLYPDAEDDEEMIRAAVETVASIPVHREAMVFIQENLLPLKGEVTYEFSVVVADGVPVITARRDSWNVEERELNDSRIFTTSGQETWPEDVVLEMVTRLRKE